jgi:hypothetical protein
MEPDVEHPYGKARITRRKALKRIGAGAAVAWSAPIITSLSTPAFAQTPIPGTCDDCNDIPCDPCPSESFSGPGVCGIDPICFCSTHPSRGRCECVFFVEGLPCDGYERCGPEPDFACPTGFRCVTTCCCFPFCAPACPEISGQRNAGARPPSR